MGGGSFCVAQAISEHMLEAKLVSSLWSSRLGFPSAEISGVLNCTQLFEGRSCKWYSLKDSTQVCDVGWLLCAQIGMRPEIEAIGGALELEKGIRTGSVLRRRQKQTCPCAFILTGRYSNLDSHYRDLTMVTLSGIEWKDLFIHSFLI